MYIPLLSESVFYFVVNTNTAFISPMAENAIVVSRTISLEKRHPVASVNEVFLDNILLNMAYMRGIVSNSSDIRWDEVRKPFRYEFILKPEETFAFQEDALSQYKDTIVKTTNAHFNLQEGFRHSGFLAGDGVCHLASLINWVAKDANLESSAPVNHDFRPIPEIPKEYGVSIYSYPARKTINAQKNLYVKNSTKNDIMFVFQYDGKNFTISVLTKDNLQLPI